jgi:hypothetical protein
MIRVSHSEIDVRPGLDVWHTDLMTSGRIIIGRRVGAGPDFAGLVRRS